MIIGIQVSGARGLLRISRQELADKAGISLSTVKRIEENKKGIHGQAENIKKLEDFFTSKGIKFTNINGIASVSIPENKI